MTLVSLSPRTLWLASAFAAAATASTAARAVDLLVNTHSTSVATPCAAIANCLDIAVTGAANDFAGAVSPIPDSWSFLLNYRSIAGIGAGTWSYTDLGPGGNNLFGSSAHTTLPLSATLLKDEIRLTILGGTGMFAGATGTGQGTAYINPMTGNSVDSTVLSITPVPEPSAAALMVAGLAAVGAFSRRLRRPRVGKKRAS